MTIETGPNRQRLVGAHIHATISGINMVAMTLVGVAGGAAPAGGEVAKYRTAHHVNCDNATVALLSLQIGRVEREWMEEAKGRPRRARN
jgi:hypothetical protein